MVSREPKKPQRCAAVGIETSTVEKSRDYLQQENPGHFEAFRSQRMASCICRRSLKAETCVYIYIYTFLIHTYIYVSIYIYRSMCVYIYIYVSCRLKRSNAPWPFANLVQSVRDCCVPCWSLSEGCICLRHTHLPQSSPEVCTRTSS